MHVSLIFLAVLAWVVHIFLLRFYNRFFKSTFLFGFRAMHAAEILATTSVILLIYRRFTDPLPSQLTVLLTVLLTFVILDAVLWKVFKDIRNFFDIWHFVAAYAVIGLAVLWIIN